MRFQVIPENELPNASMHSCSLGGYDLVVFRDDAGQITVFEDRCTHARVKISRGSYRNGVAVCPAHGAKFDTTTGQALCLPATRAMRKFESRVIDGFVEVELPDSPTTI